MRTAAWLRTALRWSSTRNASPGSSRSHDRAGPFRAASRRAALAAVALVLIGAVITALTLAGSRDGGFRPGKPAPRPSARATTAREATTRATPHRLALPVRLAQLMRARAAAKRFLGAFLAFAYGRAGAVDVRGVTPGLGRRLRRGRAAITPVELSRRPRVVWLRWWGWRPGSRWPRRGSATAGSPPIRCGSRRSRIARALVGQRRAAGVSCGAGRHPQAGGADSVDCGGGSPAAAGWWSRVADGRHGWKLLGERGW